MEENVLCDKGAHSKVHEIQHQMQI